MSEKTRGKKVKTKKSYHNAAIFCITTLNIEIRRYHSIWCSHSQ